MRQSGEYRIDAQPEAVWRGLNDPDVLQRCIEGCQSVTRVSEDAFSAVVQARIGPLSATFTGDIKLTDLDPPRSCTIEASAKGGAAGFGKGEAKVTLSEDGGGTILRYDASGNVGGKLAQVGQRLIDGVVRKMADQFFSRFGELVGGPGENPSPGPASRSRLWVWMAAGGVILLAVVAIVVLFRR
jgi:carbon monoxide dehydrogenase subunit G